MWTVSHIMCSQKHFEHVRLEQPVITWWDLFTGYEENQDNKGFDISYDIWAKFD